MSYRKRTLNLQSISYNAATNTPSLASMVDGGVYAVTTAGKLTATTVLGATVGSDSYLLVGDKVLCSSGVYSLLEPDVAYNTNITIGTSGLFTTFYTACEYIKQRTYSKIRLTLLSATVETQSVDVSNSCGGMLEIYCAGFMIDFSGTVGVGCKLSGDNIYVDRFSVKANVNNGPGSNGALVVTGNITFDNNLTSTCLGNSNALWNYGSIRARIDPLNTVSTASNFILSVPTLVSNAYDAIGAILIVNNVNTNGNFLCGTASNSFIRGNATVVGNFDCGTSSISRIDGSINTTSGVFFTGGDSSSTKITGNLNTNGGQFYAGNSCNFKINGTITTGGGFFNAGVSNSNLFIGLVSCGTGILEYGSACNNTWLAGATGTGGVSVGSGTRNFCNGQPMPAGTPVSGTNTSNFSRAG